MWIEGKGQVPGQLVVVSGPSGCGKSTILRAVLNRSDVRVELSISATTRAQRPGEQQERDYHFLDVEQFLELRDRGAFLEWAEYNAHYYGTRAQPVYDALETGRTVLLEIEVNGALQIREKAPGSLFVFIKTPTFRVLEERLSRRGTETDASLFRRLRKAREELAQSHWYDAQLINDDLESCVEKFVSLLKSNGCGG